MELTQDEIGLMVDALESHMEDLKLTRDAIAPYVDEEIEKRLVEVQKLWARCDTQLTGTEWTEEDLKN